MKTNIYTSFFFILLMFSIGRQATAQTNLALGKPVLSSSNFNAGLFPNSNLTDGNFNTFAHTNNLLAPPLGEWFQIDLGADYFIDRVTIGCRPGSANRLRRFMLVTWPSAVGTSQGDNPSAYTSQARYNRIVYTDPTGSTPFGATGANPNIPGIAGQNLGPVIPGNVLNLNIGQHKARHIFLLNLQDDYLDPTELQVFAGPPPVRAITNGGFETGVVTATVGYAREGAIPGWSTTEMVAMSGMDPSTPTDGSFLEIWRSGFNGVPAFEGSYFAELNAFTNGMVVQQPICVLPGETFGFSFAHRGRDGVDVMRLSIDDIDVAEFSDNNAQAGTHTASVLTPATTTVSGTHPTNAAGWTQYSGTWTNTSGVSKVVTFGYRAVSSFGGSLGSGNFLDAVTITSLSTMVTLNQGSGTGPESIATANLPKLYLTGELATPSTVELNITGGTATRGTDYITPTAPSGLIIVNIPAGFYDGTNATAISLAPYIQVVADLVPAEADETILMTIQNPSSISLQIADANSCGPAILNNSYTITDAPPITISGTVFNDINGLSDNTVNGSVTNAGGLNAMLLNNNIVVAVATVNAAGVFLFTNIAPDLPYTVLITTASATAGDPQPAISLPPGWVSTGENNSASIGDDGLADGISNSFTPAASTTNINFGIQEPPLANDDNSTGNTLGQAVTMAPLLNDSDPAGGTLDPTTVSLITPPGSPSVTEGNGNIIEVTVPGEGTWSVDAATGEITFTPLPGFTHNPTPISYTVADNAGSYAASATIVITYTGAILPVRMLRFDAIQSGGDVLLNWTTGQEQNSSRFEIEYSVDGIRYQKAGVVSAAGNTSIPQAYTFIHEDAALLNSGSLYYRLRQVDIDERSIYSNVIIVRINKTNGRIQIYPNPAGKGKPVTVRAQNIQVIQLYTPDGKLVWSRRFNESPLVEIPTVGLNAGFYLLKINNRNSGKIIITK